MGKCGASGWWLAAAVVMFGCGGSAESVDPVGPREPALAPARSEVEVRAAVEAMLRMQHDALGDGDVRAWAELLADDAFLFGSAPDEAIAGRDAIVDKLSKVFDPLREAGATFSVMPSDVAVGVAPGRRAAWAAEELVYDIQVGDKSIHFPFRVTAVVDQRGRNFVIVAEHWSVGLPNDQAFKLAANGKLPALAPIQDAVPPNAGDLAAVIDGHLLGDAAARAASISDHSDVFGFGSAPEEKIRGSKAMRQALGQEDSKWAPKISRKGGIHVGLAGAGEVAWAAFNMEFSAKPPDGERVSENFRVLGVLLNEDGNWKIVQWHASNGVPDQPPK